MGRKTNELESSRSTSLILILVGFISFAAAYTFLPLVLRRNGVSTGKEDENLALVKADGNGGGKNDGCCRGIENLELWGAAVKWGSEFKLNSAEQCCEACKAMCSGNDGPCLCDTWVFCGNREACGSKFGECWLKKQKDVMAPDREEAGPRVIWTSGVIFGRGEGIVGLETEYGTLHIKLLPDCAPRSVEYILELMKLRHCAGCQFYRAEPPAQLWDSEGNHLDNAPYGPPYALIQGILEVEGNEFKKIPTESCPSIKRGSVAWIDSGPEFFISLADHSEWRAKYTVFGSVLPESMTIADRISQLPTISEVWNDVNVSVLEKPVSLRLRRMERSLGNTDTNMESYFSSALVS